jgi:RNA recognition motif-containing protein
VSNRLLIGNLPPEVTEDEIKTLLAEAGAEGIEVSINREGDASKGTAVLVVPGLDRTALDRIANDINGKSFRDRTLSAYVPLFT